MDRFKLAELYDASGDLSKRWYVGYYFLHPETGKYKLFQVYISSKIDTKQARRVRANQLIDQINGKLRRGFNPFSKENISFTNIVLAIEAILKYKASYSKYRTTITDKSCCKALFTWLKLTGNNMLTIESFNHQHAYQFMDYLKDVRNISNRTYNNYKERISTIFNFLVDREYILVNPFKKIKKLPETQRTVKAYSPAEVQLLKSKCPEMDPELWIVCQLVYYCALRPAEIVRLKIRDLNLPANHIVLSGEITKNRQNSIIKLPAPMALALQQLNFSGCDPDDYIFSKNLLPGKEAIAPTRLAERFKRFKDYIGLKRNLYELKHTGIGLNIQQGANINDIKYHCRHSDIKMTEEYLKAFQSNTSDKFINSFPEL